jgi:exonuclease III
MKVITWNIRGLNSPRKQRILKSRLRKEQPDLCFIQETKCTTDRMETINKQQWSKYKMVVVGGHQMAGGILTLWNPQVLSLIAAEATRHTLTVSMQIIGNTEVILCTNVYGPQVSEEKRKMIRDLEDLKTRSSNLQWILAGDFNIITSLAEKKGGTRRLDRDAEDFSMFIDTTEMVDIKTNNGQFTWNNKRMNQYQVATRLDRFLVSESIIMQGITLECNILPWGGSDHWPVQLEAGFQTTPKNRPFRFEKFWIEHPTFKEKIKQWWREEQPEQGTRMFKLYKKLKYIKYKLKEWNKEIFGNINQGKKNIEDKMRKLQEICIAEGYTEDRKKEEIQMTQEWEARCQQEETLWRQKSRIRWLREGERNTKFFHRTTIARRAHNKILKIKDQDGIERESHKEIETTLVNHFHGIAQEPNKDRTEAIQRITQHIPHLVTEEQNNNLNKPIVEEEIDQVIQEMPNGKAPGPDGFTVEFFKACWEVVKHDVYRVVEDSRRSTSILKALNATMITLIPKENEARTPDRYRPIALCNVVYKIISKVIANRLKPLLPTLISQEQAGFMEGRQIMDNIIHAHELIHTLKTQRRGGMIIQLDLAKSYDKISWHYMVKTLEAFGFTQHWISWIVSLVSTTSYSLLINGAPAKPFWPTRGIRQGDPLSPFLFILMMEGLSRSIKSATTAGEITASNLSKTALLPHINSSWMTPYSMAYPRSRKKNPTK